METGSAQMYYDGSFSGFLTILNKLQFQSLTAVKIEKRNRAHDVLFLEDNYIETDQQKARQMWSIMRNKSYSGVRTLYYTFLSEEKDIELKLVQYFHFLYGNLSSNTKSISAAAVKNIEELADKVDRAKNNLERALFMELVDEAAVVKSISPKYNLLPLISKGIRTRYKDREWVIYDTKRKYGLHHNQGALTFVPMYASMTNKSKFESKKRKTNRLQQAVA